MEKSAHKAFKVNINTPTLGRTTVEVKYSETTDGAPYYSCMVSGKEIQIRKDEKWEQIWGKLNKEDVEALGSEIDKHLL